MTIHIKINEENGKADVLVNSSLTISATRSGNTYTYSGVNKIEDDCLRNKVKAAIRDLLERCNPPIEETEEEED